MRMKKTGKPDVGLSGDFYSHSVAWLYLGVVSSLFRPVYLFLLSPPAARYLVYLIFCSHCVPRKSLAFVARTTEEKCVYNALLYAVVGFRDCQMYKNILDRVSRLASI